MGKISIAPESCSGRDPTCHVRGTNKFEDTRHTQNMTASHT